MAILSKRSKMVSIRLSHEEFLQLQKVCVDTGARSISDLARSAMARLARGNGAQPERLDQLETRLVELQAQVSRLERLVGERA